MSKATTGQAPTGMLPITRALIRQGTEMAEFKRFIAVNPLTEAQLQASDRAFAEVKANGTLDAENARRALERQINEGGAA